MERALVLYSGGVDSTTLLYIARSEGFEPLALIFGYGQRHDIEVRCATETVEALGIDYRLQRLDLRVVGGSALTSDRVEVPRGRTTEEMLRGGVPATYVPARNTIFLAHALAWAEVEGIDEIYIGVNAVDYSGYPDCRPEYIEAFQKLANLACRRSTEEGAGSRIRAPLLHSSKAEIIRRGSELGVDFSRTWSCYSPRVGDPAAAQGKRAIVACGECDSCLLRRKGFREAGLSDPVACAG